MNINSARRLFHEKKYVRSIDQYQQLIQSDTSNAMLYLELSSALLAVGQMDEALVVAKQGRHYALPEMVAHCENQLAQIYTLQKRYDLAEEKFHSLINTWPEFLEPYIGMCSLYLKKGYASKARSILEHCESLGRNSSRWAHNYSQALFECRSAKKAIEEIYSYLDKNGPDPVLALNALMFSSYTDELGDEQVQRKADLIAQAYQFVNAPEVQGIACESKDSLRVGFVSSDFCFHPVGQFLYSFLGELGKQGVNTYLFSNGQVLDEWTKKIQGAASNFVSISEMPPQDVANLIRKENLDILIDLSGPTAGNRFDVLALRPCSVQATYLGFPDSCRMPFIDFILTDQLHVPEQARSLYTEKVVYIDDLRFCFSKPIHCPKINPAPVTLNKYLTFGSFANPAKISEQCLGFWCEVLFSIPNSRLRLQHKQWVDISLQQEILDAMSKHGVAPGRIEFHGSAKYDEYMDSYKSIDVVLDTFPFTGGTTTCEALWAGVPVVTIEGEKAASRQSSAILRSIGFEEFVAHNKSQGLAILKDIDSNVSTLDRFKAHVYKKIAESGLGNPAKFAASFKSAILQALPIPL